MHTRDVLTLTRFSHQLGRKGLTVPINCKNASQGKKNHTYPVRALIYKCFPCDAK